MMEFVDCFWLSCDGLKLYFWDYLVNDGVVGCLLVICLFGFICNVCDFVLLVLWFLG